MAREPNKNNGLVNLVPPKKYKMTKTIHYYSK